MLNATKKIVFISLCISLLSPFSLEAKERIALIAHGGVGNPFWSVVFNGAKQAAKDLDVRLQILFPNQDGDQSGTTQKLSEAISTKPDGIAVTLATAAHCEYIKEARKLNIPVIIFNAKAAKSSESCPYQAYVGMDEYEAGQESAKRALNSGRINGRVMVGLTEAGNAGLQARAKGIVDAMRKKQVKVDIVDLGNDSTSIQVRIKGYAASHRSDLSAVMIPSPTGLHPFLRMMQEDPQGLGKKYVAGFDLTPLILKGIQENWIDHSIDQQPFVQGYYSVVQLVQAARWKFTPMNMNTGAGIVEKSNAQAVADLVRKNIR